MKLLESKKSQKEEFGFNLLPGRPINSRGEGCKKDLALDKCLQTRVQKDVSPSMSPPKRKKVNEVLIEISLGANHEYKHVIPFH